MKHSKDIACRLIHKSFYNSPSKQTGRIDGLFCKTHKADCCRCGREWGKHTEGNEKYNIKQFCARCFKDMKNSMSYYMVFGNFCRRCVSILSPSKPSRKKRDSNLRKKAPSLRIL